MHARFGHGAEQVEIRALAQRKAVVLDVVRRIFAAPRVVHAVGKNTCDRKADDKRHNHNDEFADQQVSALGAEIVSRQRADRSNECGCRPRPVAAGKLLSRNLLVYGLGGLAAPFIFVKLIDILLVFTGLM